MAKTKTQPIVKINAFLSKVGMVLNILNIFIGLFIGIAHVYIAITSPTGLALGCVLALSGAVTIGISYYFTSKNVEVDNLNPNAEKNKKKQPPPTHTTLSTLFLCIAIPCFVANSAASFFGMYTGTLLLVAALALPLGPISVITLAIALASVMTAGTVINSWLQAYNIWSGLIKPDPAKMLTTTSTNKHVIALLKHHRSSKTKRTLMGYDQEDTDAPIHKNKPHHLIASRPIKIRLHKMNMHPRLSIFHHQTKKEKPHPIVQQRELEYTLLR